MNGRENLPAFRKLSALAQLELLREYPRLMPRLLELGLGLEDARALAYNAALLYKAAELSPPPAGAEEIFERYSLGEIARLCEAYHRVAAGELEYGEAGAT